MNFISFQGWEWGKLCVEAGLEELEQQCCTLHVRGRKSPKQEVTEVSERSQPRF